MQGLRPEGAAGPGDTMESCPQYVKVPDGSVTQQIQAHTTAQ